MKSKRKLSPMQKIGRLMLTMLALIMCSTIAFGGLGFDIVAGATLIATAPIAISDEQMSQINAKLKSQLEGLFQSFKEKSLSKEELEEKIKSIGFKDNSVEVEKLKTDLTQLAENYEKLKNKSNANQTFGEKLQIAFKEKKEQIEQVRKSGAGFVQVYKEKADLTPNITVAGSMGTPIQSAIRDWNEATGGDVRLRLPIIFNYVTMGKVSVPYYSYRDTVPVHDESVSDGIAKVVTEGSKKPKVAPRFESRMANAKKIAAHEIMSNEAEFDIDNGSIIAQDYLRRRVELAKAKEMLSAILTAAPAFNPLTWTAAKIPNPNLKDVIIAMMNQVVNSENWQDDVQFVPNLAMVNWADFLSMSVTKDKNEAYMFAENMRETMGIQIIPCHKNDIAVGDILVGDFAQAMAFEYEPYNVRVGHMDDQIITNEFTIVGETRFIPLVKHYNKNAFVKGTIATIATAIKL